MSFLAPTAGDCRKKNTTCHVDGAGNLKTGKQIYLPRSGLVQFRLKHYKMITWKFYFLPPDYQRVSQDNFLQGPFITIIIVIEYIKNKLENSTIIDAGHFGYKKGPSELDSYLWKLGVKLYVYGKARYEKLGLTILVDDVHGVKSNKERRKFKIKKLPQSYLEVLRKNNVSEKEVLIFSQDRIKEKGRRLIRKKDRSGTSTSQCRLIVATMLREKEKREFKNTLVLSDEIKTGKGVNMTGGTVFSRLLFDTKINVHQFVFRNKKKYDYYHMIPAE